MTVTPINTKRSPRETASEWVVRMDRSELTVEERKAFLAWLAESSAHRTAFTEMLELWTATDELDSLSDLLPLETKPSETLSKPRPSRLGYFLVAAAICVLGITFLLVALMNKPEAQQTQTLAHSYSTQVGNKKTLALPDSSSVTLNTDTKITVDFTETERRIYLHQGEAHFQVASNKDRPFVVFAGKGSIKAIGTAFNVFHEDDHIEVLVTEGTVEIEPDISLAQSGDTKQNHPLSSTKVSASVGESVRYDEAIRSIEIIDTKEVDRRLSWQRGVLIFEGEPLAFVVDQISRYTDTIILFDDSEIADIPIGGYFRAGEVSALLEALETSFEIEVDWKTDKQVVLSRQNNNG